MTQRQGGTISQNDLQIECTPYQNCSFPLPKTCKLVLKFIWIRKGPRIAKTILKQNTAEGLTLSNTNLPQPQYSSLAGLTRHAGPKTAGSGVPGQRSGEGTGFQQWCRGVHVQKDEAGAYRMPHTKPNIKRTQDLAVRTKNIKVLEKNFRADLCDPQLAVASQI